MLVVALLCRPYLGISGDARVYVGRALANLDPAVVGRDLMYSGDGQSGFSVFPSLLTAAVALLGAPVASAVVALLALAAWTGAAALLLRWWAPSADRRLLLTATLLLPCAYSGLLIRFGEAAAIPRPFAEAVVFVGLAALLAGKPLAATALMAAATGLHPIVALPGWGVMLVHAGRADRRWFAVAAGLAAAILLAAWLGAPVARRLFQPMDAAWSRGLETTAPYLFLRTWDAAVWGRTLVQAVTIGLGAALLGGRSRTLAVSVLAVAATTLVASFGLGDVARSVLVLQLQPWRSLWLLAFLSAASFPIVLFALWGLGAKGRLGAAALVVAWLSLDVPVAAVFASGASILMFMRIRSPLPTVALVFGWAGCAAAAVLFVTLQTSAILSLVSGHAYSAPVEPHILALLDVNRVVLVVVLLAACAAWSDVRVDAAVGWVAAVCATASAVFFWDARSPSRRVLEDARAAREVRMLVASRPGSIEWLGGDLQPLMLAGRPAWQSYLQSSSNVFSRAQAVEWSRRTNALVASGVGPSSLLDRFPHRPSAVLWSPSLAALEHFCSRRPAPAWIVTPVAADTLVDAPGGWKIWTAPLSEPTLDDGTHRVIAVNRYAFIPCGGDPA